METSTSVAKIAVIGGSITGCATAIAAHRAGHQVTLYERSHGDLAERGFGICLPDSLVEQCVADGYLEPHLPVRPVSERVWLTRAAAGGGQRELCRQAGKVLACNWGLLWKSLRARVPAPVYRSGQTVTALRRDGESGAIVEVGGTQEHRYDLVIGADGYKSIVRNMIIPDVRPEHAGYVTWRGVVPVADVADCSDVLDALDDAYAAIGFDGGHAIFYVIPGADGRDRINWLVYATPPEAASGGLSTSFAADTTLDKLTGWFGAVVDDHLPAQWATVVRRTPDAIKAVQPIFDLMLDRSASAPFVLAGDAAAITRPHTASGATKALQDARCLEQALREHSSWDKAAEAYNEQRNEAGNDLVRLGRRMGRDQVESTPDWNAMNPEMMRAWTQGTIAGHQVYIYSDV